MNSREQRAMHELAHDVERLESRRAVKDLQRTYAQYQQFGLWNEMASLFADDAPMRRGDELVRGRDAIAADLLRRGGGSHGPTPGAVSTEFIDQPLVTLAADGLSANARWMSLAFIGDGLGATRISGGIYENAYIRDGGTWKIAGQHYHPQFDGDHAEGWTNVGGEDLPVVPFHFTVEQTGAPVPHTDGPPCHADVPLSALEQRIAALNDEDAVRNLQNAAGYYVDRRMWDDVVDLFVEDCAVEVHGCGVFRGRGGVRRALGLMGPAGLEHGQLNDRPLFDTIVRVLPGGEREPDLHEPRRIRGRRRTAGSHRARAGRDPGRCVGHDGGAVPRCLRGMTGSPAQRAQLGEPAPLQPDPDHAVALHPLQVNRCTWASTSSDVALIRRPDGRAARRCHRGRLRHRARPARLRRRGRW